MINKKDLKRIEHLCYSFLWCGPDRVRRAVIKSERHKGGINGIDIESFFKSIAIRQYFKSNNDCRLAILNKDPFIKEDIKTVARTAIRHILLTQLGNNLDKEWILQTHASLFLKPYSNPHKLFESLNITTIDSINFDVFTRSVANRIRKSLNASILLALDCSIITETSVPKITLFYEDKSYNLDGINSKTLNFILKENLKKITAYCLATRYNMNLDLFPDVRQTWHNLWLIKNPTLRAIRLKILYKDIWCNEKRFKLGISTTNLCSICNEVESVTHQLFTCKNASKIWSIINQLS